MLTLPLGRCGWICHSMGSLYPYHVILLIFIVQDDELGETPLIVASSHGHIAVCKLLLEQGATVDYQDKVS